MSLLAFVVAVSGLLFAAGCLVLVVGLAQAPLGYEDERGFHVGKPLRSRN